ncbi:cytochrome D1 domain-containing protein [Ottowia testudinis]|uniref:C-type cytochrome n=1 Tax=Ottowia testudinis TaxID=2816950 RepID=A0A975CNW5_9BURK|nr:cytochrome D1 domain-containing protein [Ottowia testudinis]QTD46978.1 c-type cytochrome [Ottowia testudinis]
MSHVFTGSIGLWCVLSIGLASAGALAQSAPSRSSVDTAALYQQHCASCHGAQRLGGMGPALLPESLARLRKPEAIKVIQDGRPATQMSPFKDTLKPDEITALTDWIYTPVTPAPTWSDADITASRVETAGWQSWPAKPQWKADPMNLFVVVEGGDHHITLLDGDKFDPIHRFASRFALHGGPKFTPDGRYVFFGSRDGWITKYDLWNLKTVAEVRAGINMRNIAVSGDGQWVMAANYLPHTVVLFDADLKAVKTYAATTLDGKQSSRVSAVYDAEPRKSFVVALKDIPELWEISYDPKAAPIYDGLVHDYKMGEGIAKPGFQGVRRTPLDEPLDDFFFDPSYAHALGAARPHADGSPSGQVVNLDVRRKIATLPIAGMPHLGSGITFDWNGTRVLASPNLQDGVISVIDMKTWKLVKNISTPGPGFFMRSHEKTPYAWTDSMMAPKAKHIMTVIDKRTLTPVAEVKGPAGQTLAHIEFTKDGRYALASLWEDDGALIVYDAATFKEIKRLPMRKPVGKYNVFNKITRSEGTSH